MWAGAASGLTITGVNTALPVVAFGNPSYAVGVLITNDQNDNGAVIKYAGDAMVSEIWTKTLYRATARGTYRWAAGDPAISDVTAVVKLPDASYIFLSSGTGLLSHVPTLTDGAADGQFIRLINTQASNMLTLQDDRVLIGSKLHLATPRVTLAAYDSLDLIWQDGQWREVGRTVKTLSTDTTSAPGNATADTFHGRAACATGTHTVVIRSNKCVPSSVVSVTLEDLDTTATRSSVVAADGSFTVTFDANASATTKFHWVIAQ